MPAEQIAYGIAEADKLGDWAVADANAVKTQLDTSETAYVTYVTQSGEERRLLARKTADERKQLAIDTATVTANYLNAAATRAVTALTTFATAHPSPWANEALNKAQAAATELGSKTAAALTDATNQANATQADAHSKADGNKQKAIDKAAQAKQAALNAADAAIVEITNEWDEQRALALKGLYVIADLPWEPRPGDDLPEAPFTLDDDILDYAPRFVDTWFASVGTPQAVMVLSQASAGGLPYHLIGSGAMFVRTTDDGGDGGLGTNGTNRSLARTTVNRRTDSVLSQGMFYVADDIHAQQTGQPAPVPENGEQRSDAALAEDVTGAGGQSDPAELNPLDELILGATNDAAAVDQAFDALTRDPSFVMLMYGHFAPGSAMPSAGGAADPDFSISYAGDYVRIVVTRDGEYVGDITVPVSAWSSLSTDPAMQRAYFVRALAHAYAIGQRAKDLEGTVLGSVIMLRSPDAAGGLQYMRILSADVAAPTATDAASLAQEMEVAGAEMQHGVAWWNVYANDFIQRMPRTDGKFNLYYVNQGWVWDDESPGKFIGVLDPGTNLVERNGLQVPLAVVEWEVSAWFWNATTTSDWDAWFAEHRLSLDEPTYKNLMAQLADPQFHNRWAELTITAGDAARGVVEDQIVLAGGGSFKFLLLLGAADDGAAAARTARFAYDARSGRYRDTESGRFVSRKELPWPRNSGFQTRERGVLKPHGNRTSAVYGPRIARSRCWSSLHGAG